MGEATGSVSASQVPRPTASLGGLSSGQLPAPMAASDGAAPHERAVSSAPARPPPDGADGPGISVQRLQQATSGWDDMEDEQVLILTALVKPEGRADVAPAQAEFVSLVRMLRALPEAQIMAGELKQALDDHGVRLGPYQLLSLVSTAAADTGDVEVLDLWALFVTLPPTARVDVSEYKRVWERSPALLAAMDLPIHHPKTERSAVLDFIAGSAAGVAATVVGHPFDTLKVRLQLNATGEFQGVFDCMRQTFSKEGLRGFYKGMASPLVTVPLVNAVVFASYGQAKWLFERRIQREADATNSAVLRPLNVWEIMCSGAFAGFVNSVVVGPVELVKCRLQAATKTDIGSWACTKEIYNTAGLRGLCRGMSATIFREVPSYMGQFGVYEVLKTQLTPEGEETANLSAARTVLAGGCAGTVCWAVSYPFDIVKSQIQLQSFTKPRVFKPVPWFPDGGAVACAKHIWRTDGFVGFWRGIMPCLMRAFPANGAGFLAYEATWKVLKMVTGDE